MHDWQVQSRKRLGLEFAALNKLDHKGAVWLVPSQSGKGKYTVSPDTVEPFCNCPDFEEHQQPCKHVFAAQFVMRREHPDGSVSLTEAIVMSKTTKIPRPTYRQDWPNYNLAQTREKHEFQELLFDLCQPPSAYKTRSRSPVVAAVRCFVQRRLEGLLDNLRETVHVRSR
jgi:hypothetical protein